MSKLTIKTGTEDDFFQRGRQLARAADRGEALPSESTISFEDPAEVVKLITTARLAHPGTRYLLQGEFKP